MTPGQFKEEYMKDGTVLWSKVKHHFNSLKDKKEKSDFLLMAADNMKHGE